MNTKASPLVPQGVNPEYSERTMNEARERLIFLVEGMTTDRGKYGWLEGHTRIAASRWQNVLLRRTQPTIDMYIAIIGMNQEYSEWLMLGRTGTRMSGAQKEPDEAAWSAFKTHNEYVTARKKKTSVKTEDDAT